LYHLFVGPPADDFDWSEQTDQMLEGCHRFLGRLWRLGLGGLEGARVVERDPVASDVELEKGVHRLIDRMSGDYERWSYNTAVAAAMEFVNTVYKAVQSPDGVARPVLDFAVDSLLLLLAPMAPHITAELWELRHPESEPVHAQRWPVADPKMVAVEQVTMIVQVNGKVKDRLTVDASVDEAEAVRLALASPKVADALAAAGLSEPKRVIARPPGLVNVVL
jgi:leucyl-tRNA synthetase